MPRCIIFHITEHIPPTYNIHLYILCRRDMLRYTAPADYDILFRFQPPQQYVKSYSTPKAPVLGIANFLHANLPGCSLHARNRRSVNPEYVIYIMVAASQE